MKLKYQFTKRTKTTTVAVLLDGNIEKLKEFANAVDEVPLKRPIVKMTIKQFADAVEPDYALRFLKKRRAVKAFGLMKSYNRQMNEIKSYIERYRVDKLPKEERAAANVEFPTMIENMLIELVRFFHLHSFKEAEKKRVYEYMLIVKENGANAKYQTNLQREK